MQTYIIGVRKKAYPNFFPISVWNHNNLEYLRAREIYFLYFMTVSMMPPSGFTAQEKVYIGNDPATAMRLWRVNDEHDAVLLRTLSSELSAAEIGTESFDILVGRMLATVTDPANPGVGIAAPQVGILRRIVLVQRFDKEGEPFEVYVNPYIIEYSEDRQVGSEGCLSVPGHSGSVVRAEQIRISYIDLRTRGRVEEIVSGFTAVIFQHEIDHLDGKLFTDRERENQVRMISFQPTGVCSKTIDIVVENGVVMALQVDGGCRGNSQGVAALIEGMPVEDAIRRLEGIRCGGKDTSCPDQIAKALRTLSDPE